MRCCNALAALLIMLATPTLADPIVIAHRGASGYLPEHTLEAKTLAHAMGADYIEQDVVLTRDGEPLVLHDIYLQNTTDVEQRFPGRGRDDGNYYALDFTLAELRQLRAHERSYRDSDGTERAHYPQRFPLHQGHFRLATLREEIDLLSGLDRSRGTTTGLYIELKAPNWHREQGHDLAAAVLRVLEQTGYLQRPGQVFLQCFDAATLLELKAKTTLPLIQLIGENDWQEDGGMDYDAMRTESGIQRVAAYASGIGPWIPHVLDAQLRPTALTGLAHKYGLLVHPYTLRADELPPAANSVDTLHEALFNAAGVDGLFTDFPDLTRNFLNRGKH
ncbi:glycerophosphodiester phosphodiesterase [Pseudohalioglobus sediminis]|uniref:glycerophosphodiester phosphodiesterase n=1 Tax=Pseudohalioglobus sediminis TaxID=2606449 RepID=A0A5B0WUY7_9GAMM|nr:glycerophosphodiester phosphodiesterase [Pseudohalioglobus sediminis]KAA1189699.1 glycerophosphodiester phosphodiesterase [Pseudohalioglobus sediminis]